MKWLQRLTERFKKGGPGEGEQQPEEEMGQGHTHTRVLMRQADTPERVRRLWQHYLQAQGRFGQGRREEPAGAAAVARYGGAWDRELADSVMTVLLEHEAVGAVVSMAKNPTLTKAAARTMVDKLEAGLQNQSFPLSKQVRAFHVFRKLGQRDLFPPNHPAQKHLKQRFQQKGAPTLDLLHALLATDAWSSEKVEELLEDGPPIALPPRPQSIPRPSFDRPQVALLKWLCQKGPVSKLGQYWGQLVVEDPGQGQQFLEELGLERLAYLHPRDVLPILGHTEPEVRRKAIRLLGQLKVQNRSKTQKPVR